MAEVLKSGSDAFDELLDGGFEPGIITTVYGPSGSGKTNVVLLAAVGVASRGKKVIFMDTEGGYSVERLKQLSTNAEKTLSNMAFLHPTNYKEQHDSIVKLPQLINDKIGLIVVESVAMQYRLELAKREPGEVNRELGLQLSYLTQIARTKGIPVLVTTQVYSMFDERERVALSGGDLVRYASKCLIELQLLRHGKRRAIIRKHRHLPEEKDIFFEIKSDGLYKTERSRFSLFGK